MAVVSVSLPDDLVQHMDAAIEREGAPGRSAFVRAAIRERADRQTPGGHIHGSITVAYRHGEEPRISEVRHAFHDVVLSLMHTHCDPTQCMDVLLVGGDAARILDLHATLERMRQVDRAVLVPITTPTADGDGAGR
ncbi:MAG: CopG family ribbon-helix-helix protein [Thermoplasmatota archaeon]